MFMKKKKYIKPETEVIYTVPLSFVCDSTGAENANAKQRTSFGDESDDSESAPTTGWAKVGTAWDDEL